MKIKSDIKTAAQFKSIKKYNCISKTFTRFIYLKFVLTRNCLHN
jgi:hypothetical protein